MDRWLTNAPRWLLLGALVYAPWAFGSTPLWTVDVLNVVLGICAGLWLLTCLLRRAWPSVHPAAVVVGLLLAAQACFMIGNARYEYDTRLHEFIPLSPLLPWAAGSLHRELSFESAIQIGAMLGVVCLACDMTRQRVWRSRLLFTIAGTGTSIAMLGLLQKLTHATAIFWGRENMGHTFFATYRYHANAGAFLNLIWPIVAGFVAVAYFKTASGWKRIAWSAALVLCLAAVFVNTSRAAAALGALMLALCLAWTLWQLLRGRLPQLNVGSTVVTVLILVGLVTTVAAMAGLDTSLKRWSRFGREVNQRNPRLLAAQVCLDMAPQAGWMGFGPGTFQTAFPYFTHRFGNQLRGRWLYAHQDYLQMQIEWGYVGSALWAMLVVGGIGYSMRRACRHRAALSVGARVTHMAILFSLAGVLLHALVDFPLQVASIQLYAATLLGLLWGSKHWLCPPTTTDSRLASRRRRQSRPDANEMRAGWGGQPARDLPVSIPGETGSWRIADGG